jgi:hypothetical protein
VRSICAQERLGFPLGLRPEGGKMRQKRCLTGRINGAAGDGMRRFCREGPTRAATAGVDVWKLKAFPAGSSQGITEKGGSIFGWNQPIKCAVGQAVRSLIIHKTIRSLFSRPRLYLKQPSSYRRCRTIPSPGTAANPP